MNSKRAGAQHTGLTKEFTPSRCRITAPIEDVIFVKIFKIRLQHVGCHCHTGAVLAGSVRSVPRHPSSRPGLCEIGLRLPSGAEAFTGLCGVVMFVVVGREASLMLRCLIGDHSAYRPNLKNPALRPTGQGRCLPPGAKLLRFK